MNSTIKLFRAKLHTGDQTADILRAKFDNVTDEEIAGYVKIMQAMNQEEAIVLSPSLSGPDMYDFIALTDRDKDRELSYLMEQDPFVGCYIDQREEFDRDYDSGQYSRDAGFCLEKDMVEILEVHQ